MDNIRTKANELLKSGDVKVVIGYGEGFGGRVRAVFIQKPEDTARLIFDERCKQNLAVYLTKQEVKALGKPAIVATLPVLRTIAQLASEEQIKENDISIIPVTDGKVLDFSDLKSAADYISRIPLELSHEEKEAVERINKMTPSERWEFWKEELSDCIKCYACRASCPLCYCERCTVDCNQPQWISVPPHAQGNMEWHIMRAMHLAGRCVNCGECFRACSLKIPLNLLTQKIISDIKENFGEEGSYALSTFKPDDKENFIR